MIDLLISFVVDQLLIVDVVFVQVCALFILYS